MPGKFASQGDLGKKKISFTPLAQGAFGFTAEGDPNSGVVIGEEGILVVDAQATPALARSVLSEIRKHSDLPIKYLVLSHYHAVRVLGAEAYMAEDIVASDKTLEMIKERGEQDWLSEFQRFPRLFQGHEEIKSLTWPTKIFKESLTLELGNKLAEVLHLGEGHTRGDTIVWLPGDRILFSGDLVESGATPYCGDAQLLNWPNTLDRLAQLKPAALVPGRGNAVVGEENCLAAIQSTRSLILDLLSVVKSCIEDNGSLKDCYEEAMLTMRPKYGHWVIFEHCMCFNVSRAYDEISGIRHPRIWTDERDIQMWEALEG
jgi:glyoxylase-like metal-dependent hydrolase (beta-lactamase superfamily II)